MTDVDQAWSGAVYIIYKSPIFERVAESLL